MIKFLCAYSIHIFQTTKKIMWVVVERQDNTLGATATVVTKYQYLFFSIFLQKLVWKWPSTSTWLPAFCILFHGPTLRAMFYIKGNINQFIWTPSNSSRENCRQISY